LSDAGAVAIPIDDCSSAKCTRPYLLLLAVGLPLRILVFYVAGGILWPDSYFYYHTAHTFAADGIFARLTPYNTPLYPTFLSAFFTFGETRLTGLVIVGVQHFLGLAAVLLFYSALKKIIPTRLAFIAALLLDVHTLLLFYETVILTEILFVFLFSVVLYKCVEFLETKSIGDAIVLGGAFAALTLTRPIAQFLPVIFIICIARSFSSYRLYFLRSGLVFLSYLVMLVPWVIANHISYEYWGISKGQGINLFLRVYELDKVTPKKETAFPKIRGIYRHFKQEHPEEHVYFYVRNYLHERGFHHAYIDDQLRAFAFEGLMQDPMLYAKNTFIELLHYFFAARNSVHFCEDNEPLLLCSRPGFRLIRPAFPRERTAINPTIKGIMKLYFKYFQIPMRLVSLLAFFGVLLYAYKGKYNPLFWFSCAVTAYFSLLTCLLNFYEDRYRLPIDIFLFAYASYAVYFLITSVKAKTKKPIAL